MITWRNKTYERSMHMELLNNYFNNCSICSDHHYICLDNIECFQNITEEQFNFVWFFEKNYDLAQFENNGVTLIKAPNFNIVLKKTDFATIMKMAKYLMYDKLIAILLVYEFVCL